MFCNASKTLCRQMKAVSLLMPQISAERRTVKLLIIHSMNLDQVSNDFLECSVIVLVRTVKDLLQSLQINLWIELRSPFFTIFVDLQCGQEEVCLIKLKPLSQLADEDVSFERKAISSAFSCCESDFMILNNSVNLATYYKIGQNFWTSNKINRFYGHSLMIKSKFEVRQMFLKTWML